MDLSAAALALRKLLPKGAFLGFVDDFQPSIPGERVWCNPLQEAQAALTGRTWFIRPPEPKRVLGPFPFPVDRQFAEARAIDPRLDVLDEIIAKRESMEFYLIRQTRNWEVAGFPYINIYAPRLLPLLREIAS